MSIIEKIGLLQHQRLVPARLAAARGLVWAAKRVAPVAVSGVGEHPEHGVLGHVLVVGDDGLNVCAALILAADKVRAAVERSEGVPDSRRDDTRYFSALNDLDADL